jgi:hypothetical protein
MSNNNTMWKLDCGDQFSAAAAAALDNNDALMQEISPERRFGNLFQAYVEKRRDPASHQKHTYPAFRKIFWEEPVHNPHLQTTSDKFMHVACEAFDAERKEYWKCNVPKWQPAPAFERITPGNNDPTNCSNGHQSTTHKKTPKDIFGPPRPKKDTFPIEKAEQYWGRERRINPYARARVYTRPQDRCRPVTKDVSGTYIFACTPL